MHYSNGREAKNGDLIVMIESLNSMPKAGVLAFAIAGNDNYNGRILMEGGSFWTPNLAHCIHIEDVKAIMVKPTTPA